MSQPDFGRPANAGSPWPYGTPDQVPIYEDPGNDTQPYPELPELHHAGAASDDSGPRDSPQGSGLPPDWPGDGAYIPGPDDQPSWDGSPRPAPYDPSPYRESRRRPAGRTIVIAALLLAVAAAIAVIAFPRAIRLSPASNPETRAGQPGSSATTGSGHAGKGGPQPAAAPPAITKAEAERVVSHYWQVNNQANESYSDSLPGTIESGSSYTMDAGSYRFALGSQDKTPYVAFKLTDARYYIPHLPRSAYPRWFVVRGSYVTLSTGKNLGSTYIVFARDSAGASWKDVVEPTILPGHAPPQTAADSGGYAVSLAANADGLSVAPDKIGQVTAAWLDQVVADPSNTAVLADAGNLMDLKDEVFWKSGKGGESLRAADGHFVPRDPVLGLKAANGGALLFYTVDAHLVLTPPTGDTISGLSIPGYYSPSSSAGLTSAAVGYIEQFASYVPAAGHSGRHIVGDVSSIASGGLPLNSKRTPGTSVSCRPDGTWQRRPASAP